MMREDKKAAPKTRDEYISVFREEAAAYGISTFRQNGTRVHFTGFGKHTGFYPAPSGIAGLKKGSSAYDG